MATFTIFTKYPRDGLGMHLGRGPGRAEVHTSLAWAEDPALLDSAATRFLALSTSSVVHTIWKAGPTSKVYDCYNDVADN